jgi:hypothetical protein
MIASEPFGAAVEDGREGLSSSRCGTPQRHADIRNRNMIPVPDAVRVPTLTALALDIAPG